MNGRSARGMSSSEFVCRPCGCCYSHTGGSRCTGSGHSARLDRRVHARTRCAVYAQECCARAAPKRIALVYRLFLGCAFTETESSEMADTAHRKVSRKLGSVGQIELKVTTVRQL